jgi:uncharacterized peroxidase-related enzyme
MTRLKLQNEFTEDPEIKKVFDEVKEMTGGEVPMVFRALALQPHILQVVWNKMSRISSEGKLPYQLKESIAIAVSNLNGCKYCVKFHTKTLKNEGFSDEEIGRIMKGESEDEKIDFVLKFCLKATKNPEEVTDEDLKALRDFGYGDEEILEILAVMEMYTGLNKMLVILDLPTTESHGCCG